MMKSLQNSIMIKITNKVKIRVLEFDLKNKILNDTNHSIVNISKKKTKRTKIKQF